MQIIGNEKKLIDKLLAKAPFEVIQYLLFNSFLSFFLFIYIAIRYTYINSEIPFFYTKYWGDAQLAPKSSLYIIPAFIALTLPFAVVFYYKARTYYLQFLDKLSLYSFSFTYVLLAFSTFRIVFSASKPFDPLVNPALIDIVPAFALTMLFSYLVTPKFIELFRKYRIITNPSLHQHPAMILQEPSVRGGGLIFSIVFFLGCAVFVGFPSYMLPIYLGVILLGFLGILDDFQNTHVYSKLKVLENPTLRLFLLFIIIAATVVYGSKISFVNNPFGGTIDFTAFSLDFLPGSVAILPILITIAWIVWVLNLLSWSNGVDGQYGGIVGIALVVIAILSLRFDTLLPLHIDIATAALIAAGTSFGLTRHTWFPSKILWGFGALSAGFVIASTSIMIGAKIATATVLIMVPFLDAIVTVCRRLLQKRNPLKGDTGHLHHVLLRKGWGVRRVALFYWSTTLISGIIAVMSANRDTFLIVLTFGGLIAFFILLLNVSKRFLNLKSVFSSTSDNS